MSNKVTVPAYPNLELSARDIRAAWKGRGEGETLVLDLDAVLSPTAAGLGQVVALHTRVRASGGHLVVSNASDWVYEVFAVMRLTDLLDIRRADQYPLSILA